MSATSNAALLSGSAPGKCEVAFIVDPLCEATKSVAGTAKDIATAPFRFAADSAVDMVTSWVAEGARWLLGRTVDFIQDSTTPRLGSEWFSERYDFMVGLGALVLLPLLMIAVIRAIVTQDIGQLLRSFGLYLPAAILCTFLAVTLTQAMLQVTDGLSETVSRNVAGDTSAIFDSVGETLSNSTGGLSPGLPSFVVFLGGILVIVGAFLVWLELLIRSAAVTVSVFFLPVVLAALVWPATMRWTRRMIEILVALILSKFVIVAVISLATAALSDPGQGGFGTVMGGGALMLMAAMSPFALLRLMPMVEASAIDHLDRKGRSAITTVSRTSPVQHALGIMKSKVGLAPAAAAGVAGGGATVAASGAARAATRSARSVDAVTERSPRERSAPPDPRPKPTPKKESGR